MPAISRFFGIVIKMYFGDHEPAHFHATYQGFQAVIGVRDLAVLRGELPPRALGLVMEWAADHREELIADWELARAGKPLQPIAPLE